MVKPAYIASGTLTSIVDSNNRVVTVDAGLHAIISALLGGGDWTYLLLQDDVNTEIVKIIGVLSANRLQVVRGVDFTIPASFLAGTALRYVDTMAAILDSIAINPLALSVSNGASLNGRELEYKEITITTLGDMEVAGDTLADIVKAIGCCSLLPETARLIPDTDVSNIRNKIDYKIDS